MLPFLLLHNILPGTPLFPRMTPKNTPEAAKEGNQ